MRKSIKVMIGAACAVFMLVGGNAQAKKVTIRVQSVIPATADEVVMLKQFGANVSTLTNGETSRIPLRRLGYVGHRDVRQGFGVAGSRQEISVDKNRFIESTPTRLLKVLRKSPLLRSVWRYE